MVPLFVGRNLIKLNSTASTNNYSTELIRTTNVIEGTIVWALEQTAGRGQRGNIWESEAGKNLTFSLILLPHFISIDQQYYITKITALAVYDFLTDEHNLKGVSIKWPNDVYVGEKKIAGILIENSISRQNISSSIIGIGLNVNQQDFHVSGAGSLSLLTGKTYDLNDCLTSLSKYIEKWYLILRSMNFQHIDDYYIKVLKDYRKFRDFKLADKTINAKITGVSLSGKLILETETGKKLECGFKEILF